MLYQARDICIYAPAWVDVLELLSSWLVIDSVIHGGLCHQDSQILKFVSGVIWNDFPFYAKNLGWYKIYLSL